MVWAENKIAKRRNIIRQKKVMQILNNNQKCDYRCKLAFVEDGIESDIRFFNSIMEEGLTKKGGITHFRVNNNFDYTELKKILRKNHHKLLLKRQMEAKSLISTLPT